MSRLFCLFTFLLFIACKESAETLPTTVSYKKLRGITMGVISYNITYKDVLNYSLQPAIDSLLTTLNMGSSTYEKSSTISQFNQSTNGITIENVGPAVHFIQNLLIAQEVVAKTDGYFDPTIAPLMKYYGFRKKGLAGVAVIDTMKVEALLQHIGFDKISLEKKNNQYTISKKEPTVQLDFSAIAKGYAIDEVGRFLEKKGIRDYLIEIGGEVRARGKNAKGNWWKIAIQKPAPEAAEGYFMNTPLLKNHSMATSGNYESYRIINGRKMGHTMNPKTGFPELNPLLSATVFSKDCIIADSYATALMAMGVEKAYNLAEKLPEIEAYLVYVHENGNIVTKYTSGLEGIIIENRE